MGYAIVAYFDLNTDNRIKEMWKLMADKSIDNYLINSENDAHFKFDMFDNIDVISVERAYENGRRV